MMLSILCLLSICIFSFQKFLSKSLTHFYLVCIIIIELEKFFILDASSLSYIYHWKIYFLQFWGYLFTLLCLQQYNNRTTCYSFQLLTNVSSISSISLVTAITSNMTSLSTLMTDRLILTVTG